MGPRLDEEIRGKNDNFKFLYFLKRIENENTNYHWMCLYFSDFILFLTKKYFMRK